MLKPNFSKMNEKHFGEVDSKGIWAETSASTVPNTPVGFECLWCSLYVTHDQNLPLEVAELEHKVEQTEGGASVAHQSHTTR